MCLVKATSIVLQSQANYFKVSFRYVLWFVLNLSHLPSTVTFLGAIKQAFTTDLESNEVKILAFKRDCLIHAGATVTDDE